MSAFVLRRILLLIPTALGISIVSFYLIHLAPGDPATAILGVLATPDAIARFREIYHLDQPIEVQYLRWLGAVVSGDLGTSLISPTSVSSLLAAAAVPTIMLTGLAVMIAVPLGIGSGVISAVHKGRLADALSRAGWLLGLSVPSFWLGLLLILVFGVSLRWLPAGGFVPPSESILGAVGSLILPAITVAIPMAAIISRISRAATLDILGADFVRTAASKGLRSQAVLARHVVPNAMVPTVTAIGLQVGYLLGGAVIVESIFNIPGVGRLLIFAVGSRDYAVVQGIVLISAVVVILVQLGTDVLAARLDPRIRLR